MDVGSGYPGQVFATGVRGRVYVVSDNGVASCFDTSDGTQIWKQRIGGDYSASPLLAGGLIYFGSHEGAVTIIQPGDQGDVVAKNQLEGKIMASPAVVDNALVLRTEDAIYRID